MKKRTRVRTVTCLDCGAEFYSRAHHDYRLCGCQQQTMVDGGFEYMRYGGVDMTKVYARIRYVPFTKQELYQDWNTRTDKLGVITKGATNART